MPGISLRKHENSTDKLLLLPYTHFLVPSLHRLHRFPSVTTNSLSVWDDPPSPLGFGGREYAISVLPNLSIICLSGDDRFRHRDAGKDVSLLGNANTPVTRICTSSCNNYSFNSHEERCCTGSRACSRTCASVRTRGLSFA